jgi:hypothetical protein
MTDWQRTDTTPDGHTGPNCKGGGLPFYYDLIPERHEGSGYCWICFDERTPVFDAASSISTLPPG